MRLLFFRGKSAISAGIKFFTWGEYSHVAVLTDSGTIIEAWHRGGVIENPLHQAPHTPGTQVDVFSFGYNFDLQAFISGMRSEVGKKYDFAGVFGFLRRRKIQNPDKWFCSELVFSKLRKAGCIALECPDYKVDPTLLSYSPLFLFEKTITLKGQSE